MTDLTVRVRPGDVPDTVIAEGYATGFGDDDRHDGPKHEGWIERIDREVFLNVVSAKPEIDLLINFEGWPLARTKSASMTVSVDDAGLRIRATLLETDPDVARMLKWMNKHPDAAVFSFGYLVKEQEWSDDYRMRVISKLEIRQIGIVIDDPEFLH
jgi:uncharacterized protein